MVMVMVMVMVMIIDRLIEGLVVGGMPMIVGVGKIASAGWVMGRPVGMLGARFVRVGTILGTVLGIGKRVGRVVRPRCCVSGWVRCPLIVHNYAFSSLS